MKENFKKIGCGKIMNYELLREWVRAEIDYSCADGSTNKERDVADRLLDELKATNNAGKEYWFYNKFREGFANLLWGNREI